jgi:F-type H+-transporting ATPase subunit b
LDKLGISLGLLVSQLVNFILLAALLYILLYKPILNMLHQRQERIARSMADADAARASAVKAQQEYERRVAEGQRKAQEIIAQATQQGEQVRAEIRAEAMREAEEIRQKAHQEAVDEKGRVMADVQGQIASLSMLATERVLSQGLDESMQRKLINQFLAELGDGGKAVPGAATVRDGS